MHRLVHGLESSQCLAGAGGDDRDATTVFVKGFDTSLGEDAIRNQLFETFGSAGEVSAVRLPTDRESGELKGIGFVQFTTAEGKVCLPPGLEAPGLQSGPHEWNWMSMLMHW